jgi:VWFA-related protein
MSGRIFRGIAATAVGIALTAHAQVSLDIRARSANATPAPGLRIDSNLVLVPVVVSDRKNRPVVGLERGQFRVFDDKVEQTVTQFAMDDEPLAVGLVFDVSGSMGSKLRRSRLAAAEFFKTSNPEDESFLVTFSDRPKLAVPLTTDTEQIQNRLTFTASKGNTALLDAVYLALSEIKRSNKPRKALLVISDGGDNNSRYTEGELKSLVRESNVLIYGIGIFEDSGTRRRTLEEFGGPDLLSDLAEQTGGREIPVDHVKDLPDVAAKIGIELRSRYLLGFSPADTRRDGRYHRLQVKVVQPRGMPKLEAHWRAGYYAPAQ